MPIFDPITRISGTIPIAVTLRQKASVLKGTLPIAMTFDGAARKDGVADIRGTVPIAVTLTGTATQYQSHVGEGDASLAPLRALGSDYSYSEGRSAFAPLEADGSSGLPEGDYAIGEGSLALLATFGIGLTGGVGEGDVSLRPLGSIGSDYAYSAGIVALEPLETEGIDELFSPDMIFSRAVARARYHIRAPVSLVTLSSEATAIRRIPAVAGSTGIVSSDATARARYHVIAPNSGIVESSASYLGEPVTAWVFTLGADAPPVSRYAGFDFNSFVQIGGRYYAASDAGIFELGGENDDGAEIEGYILTGRAQQGTDRRTSVPILYVTGRSAGVLHVRVIDEDGAEYDYTTERALGNVPSRERVKFGRGHRMTFWRYRIGNERGEDFELTDAGTLVDVRQRRVR